MNCSRLQASKGSVKIAKNSKLFLGFGIAMVGSSLTYVTHWMIYEYFKRHLTPLVHGNETLVPFVYMSSAAMGNGCDWKLTVQLNYCRLRFVVPLK